MIRLNKETSREKKKELIIDRRRHREENDEICAEIFLIASLDPEYKCYRAIYDPLSFMFSIYLMRNDRDNATIIVYSSDDIVGEATRGTSSINFLVASREMKASYGGKRGWEKEGITFHRGKGATFPAFHVCFIFPPYHLEPGKSFVYTVIIIINDFIAFSNYRVFILLIRWYPMDVDLFARICRKWMIEFSFEF